MTFQSQAQARGGSSRTDRTVKRLTRRRHENLVMSPPGFSADQPGDASEEIAVGNAHIFK